MQIYILFSLQTTGKHPSVTKLYLKKKKNNDHKFSFLENQMGVFQIHIFASWEK